MVIEFLGSQCRPHHEPDRVTEAGEAKLPSQASIGELPAVQRLEGDDHLLVAHPPQFPTHRAHCTMPRVTTESLPTIGAHEAILIARGIASAVGIDGQVTAVQASLLREMFEAAFDERLDVATLAPLAAPDLAAVLADHAEELRHRVVNLMVLGVLILRPIPLATAQQVAEYARALDAYDQFVRIAHRYAQGGFGLAWLDLQRSGFAEHWEMARMDQLKSTVKLENQLAAGVEDAPLAELWDSFQHFPPGTLGREVWNMYRGRGFALPGSSGGASAYLAQHDMVHVLADYGTNLPGELEVFSLISRADPDPRGFAWVATLVGLFSTGYIDSAGFFDFNVEERRLDEPAMHVRIADAWRRGRLLRESLGTDLLEVDYHEFTSQPVDEVRDQLGIAPKSERARAAGSAGVFDPEGMTKLQLEYAASLKE